jgi:predicted ArsR family transcriptional regulator
VLSGVERDQAGRPTSARRRAVLDAVRGAGCPQGIAEVAARLGVHPNTVRFHLDALVARGEVVRSVDKPSGPGRPRTVYAARPGTDRGGVRRYQLLARMLLGGPAGARGGTRDAGEAEHGPVFGVGGPRADPAAAAAVLKGRAWGRHLVAPPPTRGGPPTEPQALGAVTAMLADLGFDPQPYDSGAAGADHRTDRIRLRHCPFLELAEEHGPIVCSLHLGLIQGALAGARAPLAATGIEPFAEPGACMAHLAPAPRPASAAAPAGTPAADPGSRPVPGSG